jgi:hypothetical protein
MNVVSMMSEIYGVADSVVGESSLPYFALTSNDLPNRMGESSFDQLDCALECDAEGRSEQEMYMFRHEDERVQLVAVLATVMIKDLKKQTSVGFDDKHSSGLPGRESNEISTRRGHQSCRFQGQTSAARSRLSIKVKSARVKLVPFPAVFRSIEFVLGKRPNTAKG